MTDRELLERAAKAAGIKGEHYSGIPGYADGVWFDEGGQRTCWNPLQDDGDALRLAVKLRMLVEIGPYAVAAVSAGRERFEDGDIPEAIEPWHVNGPDINVSTRRAIVRAAAAMSEG